MGPWMKVKLAQVCSSISDGDHLPPPKCESGIPFVTISDIKNNKFDLSNTRFVPKAYFDTIDEKRRIRKGDVLYSVVGSYGIPVYADTDLEIAFQRHIAILKPSSTVDSRFLYYSVLSPAFYNAADNVAIGAAQKTITLSALRNLEIPLPPLPVQRRIADILSAYDDLIENNRRRIAILEETARLAYRKWLSENYALIKTTKIGEFVDLQNGFAFKSNTFVAAGQYKIITIKNVKDVIVDSGNVAFVESIPARMPAHCRILPKDILLSLTGNVGRVSIAIEQNGLLNQRVAKVKSDFPWFSLLVLKSNECFRLMNNLAVGTAQQNLSPVKLCDEFIEVPTRTGMAHVERLVAPLFDHIVLLAQQSVALAAARDMLLPRLMKGQPCFSSL